MSGPRQDEEALSPYAKKVLRDFLFELNEAQKFLVGEIDKYKGQKGHERNEFKMNAQLETVKRMGAAIGDLATLRKGIENINKSDLSDIIGKSNVKNDGIPAQIVKSYPIIMKMISEPKPEPKMTSRLSPTLDDNPVFKRRKKELNKLKKNRKIKI